jgi:hypothetical protein
MGQPIVNLLARHGVGSRSPGGICIVDGDVVSERNLIGTEYRLAHVGQPKGAAAAAIIKEINDETNVTYWNHHLTPQDAPRVVDLARRSELIGLFADSFDLMLDIADLCASICPAVMAVFGPHADHAEVAFSIPKVTPSLRKVLGNRPRQRIAAPSAFGCDTLYVASFVAALCLELLLAPQDQGRLVQCHNHAPLFVMGLRKSWIFQKQPEDVARSIVYVQVPHETKG